MSTLNGSGARIIGTRIGESIVIAAVTASISVYTTQKLLSHRVEGLENNVNHLTQVVYDLNVTLNKLDAINTITAESNMHRLTTLEDRAKNLAARIRDLEKLAPRTLKEIE